MLRVISIAGAVLFLAALAMVGGFFDFESAIPKKDAGLQRTAEGIVVPTGGDERIKRALELLRDHRGKRLLVTGEPSSTSLNDMAVRIPGFDNLIRCCVDLDHVAINTAGNAIAARQWARERGFESLIVVTSRYHIPRTMKEFRYQLPDAQLIGAPVVMQQSMNFFVLEYLKFLFSQLRIGLGSLFVR